MIHTETAAALRAQANKIVAAAAQVRSKKIRMPMLCDAVVLRQRAEKLEKMAAFGAALAQINAEDWEAA